MFALYYDQNVVARFVASGCSRWSMRLERSLPNPAGACWPSTSKDTGPAPCDCSMNLNGEQRAAGRLV
ncbi:MAG: hypothetical protein IPJ97_17590 [Proteobacteria bacterium]|nr:hypothetical protein [Pseudomonadota bacterium]